MGGSRRTITAVLYNHPYSIPTTDTDGSLYGSRHGSVHASYMDPSVDLISIIHGSLHGFYHGSQWIPCDSYHRFISYIYISCESPMLIESKVCVFESKFGSVWRWFTLHEWAGLCISFRWFCGFMFQVLCIRMFPISILVFRMWPSCLEPWTLPSCLTSCAFHQLRLVVPCPNLRSSKNARAATTLLVPEREPMDIKEKRVGRAWRKPSNKTTLYSGPSFAFCSAPGG